MLYITAILVLFCSVTLILKIHIGIKAYFEHLEEKPTKADIFVMYVAQVAVTLFFWEACASFINLIDTILQLPFNDDAYLILQIIFSFGWGLLLETHVSRHTFDLLKRAQ